MSGFKALNIESDDESDIELDDTKEIQIEEALKLYQTALKYHAEGPCSFDQAEIAYEKLFQSEIFQYPESQTELQRFEQFGPVTELDDVWLENEPAVTTVVSGVLDGGPSTLPQILHLSHRNYGQLKLEHLTARLKSGNVSLSQIREASRLALDHFVSALDKDDSDLELWQRTAAAGELLDSIRVVRLCLEAVLDSDEEGPGGLFPAAGIEEGVATEKVRQLVKHLEDNLSLMQLPRSFDKRRVLWSLLKEKSSFYPQIAQRKTALRDRPDNKTPPRVGRVKLPKPLNWASIGESLLQQQTVEQQGIRDTTSAIAIEFDLSAIDHPISDRAIGSAGLAASNSERYEEHGSSPVLEHQPTSPQKETLGLERAKIADNEQDPSAAAEAKSPIALPTRKRSGEIAGVGDGNEDGRTKSKRIRTRESTTVEENKQAIIDANTLWEYEQQLNEFQAADDWMFDTVGALFERIDVVGLGVAKDVRQKFQDTGSERNSPGHCDIGGLELSLNDLNHFLKNYSDKIGSVFLAQGEDLSSDLDSGTSGLGVMNISGAHSKPAPKLPDFDDDGLTDFLESVNRSWFLVEDVAREWILRLLKPQDPKRPGSNYVQVTWSEQLKATVVQVLVAFDDSLFQSLQKTLSQCVHSVGDNGPPNIESFSQLIQAIFELHLDIYCHIKRPQSRINIEKIETQGIRLQRWSNLAQEALHLRSLMDGVPDVNDQLNLRLLWATTFHLSAVPDTTQDHVIECMNDVRAMLVAADEPIIHLPNNAIMPELSVAALDREISRLMTSDFFAKVTGPEDTDPVSIIESLEPLLESLLHDSPFHVERINSSQDKSQAAVSSELLRYVRESDFSVRLLLWQRLRDSYLAIDYHPMVLKCHFRTMQVVFNETQRQLSSLKVKSDRQIIVLKSLAMIKGIIAEAHTLIHHKQNTLECIDAADLRSVVSTFGQILQLLQVFNIYEDSIRVGQAQAPTLPNGLAMTSFEKVSSQLREMQIHIWLIMYSLLKETISQFPDLFPAALEDRFDFLRVVHRNLGLRGMCGESNRALVRLLKDEFFHMTDVEGYDSEQSQVLYDLYGLNCFLDPNYELIEHDCTHDAFLDRGVAMQVVDLLLLQASKLPIKDLIKHPIKDTIDKVHGSAPRKKPTEAILRNREIYRAFLRSPINPLDLFACINGEGNELPISFIPKEDVILASKGWYFLMGHIALTKFRSQKRTAPTPTEDVEIAIAFFMQDLEYSADNWETWFRLAQAYDTKVDESVVWSAEKLNNNMAEVVQLQRATLHCYIMATALAYRSADVNLATYEKITELYYRFGLRLYASSRAPFGMLAFAMDENERFVSMPAGIEKRKSTQPLRAFTAWKLAKHFLTKSIDNRNPSWTVHLAIAKCLWKMYSASDEERLHDKAPPYRNVLDAIVRAIELLPDNKNSREKREPILEPHYRLVSIVHKLVTRGDLDLEEAQRTLWHTPFARTKTFPQSRGEWIPYVLIVLKNLRTADKSNWYHRMIARTARIVYESGGASSEHGASDPKGGATAAKYELTQQMFTKTMVLQVWRPECERAGRHFVYTARYTRFFVSILEQLGDRNNLEMLARRVRRRPQEIFEHSLVWQEICNAYLRLLRNYANVGDGLETSTFSNIAYDDFVARKEPLEQWMQGQDNGVCPALDVLREVQELKKINQSLMKPSLIDDLIGDTYALLFDTKGKELWEDDRKQKEDGDAQLKREEESKQTASSGPAQSPARNPMMSLMHLMNIDGLDSAIPSTQSTTRAPTPVAKQNPSDAAPAPAPARRKIGVGRREIRNCAEGCFQRASASLATTATATATPARPDGQTARVQAVINTDREEMAGDTSAATSAPGSVHDEDSDDELSELEEEDMEDLEGHDGDDEAEAVTSPAPEKSEEPSGPHPNESRASSEGFQTADEGVVRRGDRREQKQASDSSRRESEREAGHDVEMHDA